MSGYDIQTVQEILGNRESRCRGVQEPDGQVVALAQGVVPPDASGPKHRPELHPLTCLCDIPHGIDANTVQR
jgi:hypothetical protein